MLFYTEQGSLNLFVVGNGPQHLSQAVSRVKIKISGLLDF
jgi:hypothetical protein